MYGENEDHRSSFPYVKTCFENNEPAYLSACTQVLDYIDVEKAGEIITKLASDDFSGYANVCSGVGRTLKSLVTEYAISCGKKDLQHFDKADVPQDTVGVPPFDLGST